MPEKGNCFEESWLDGRKTASWSVDVERGRAESEGNKRKIEEAAEMESTTKGVKMSDECMDGLDRSLSSWRCKRGYCKQCPNGSDLQNRNDLGLSKGTTDPVTLQVMSWNVAGLPGDSTDIFLLQISMLTDWDVLLLQEYFRKLDGE